LVLVGDRLAVILRGRRTGANLDAPTMTTASAAGNVGRGQARWWARLTPEFDILRLTTPGEGPQPRPGQQPLGDFPLQARLPQLLDVDPTQPT
jgi:hypothetical protein